MLFSKYILLPFDRSDFTVYNGFLVLTFVVLVTLCFIALARLYIIRKENKNYKFYISLLINGAFILLFIYSLVASMIEIGNKLK